MTARETKDEWERRLRDELRKRGICGAPPEQWGWPSSSRGFLELLTCIFSPRSLRLGEAPRYLLSLSPSLCVCMCVHRLLSLSHFDVAVQAGACVPVRLHACASLSLSFSFRCFFFSSFKKTEKKSNMKAGWKACKPIVRAVSRGEAWLPVTSTPPSPFFSLRTEQQLRLSYSPLPPSSRLLPGQVVHASACCHLRG